ncbi:MAG: ISKra4 family transposase [Deltaproteobacteria bacterium]|nr:ISKra4 family transposase [Deltaproteobacteria bacterium]
MDGWAKGWWGMQIHAGLAGGLGRRIRVQPGKEEPKRIKGKVRKPADGSPDPAVLAAALVPAERGAAFGIERDVEEQFGPQLTEETRRRFQKRADEVDARRPVCCPKGGCAMERKGRSSRPVKTVHGDFRFQRDRWYCATHKVTRYPADEELGLRTREPLSPLTLMRSVLLTILMPFEQARQLLLDFWGMGLGRHALWNATQRAGRMLRMQQDLEAEACHTVHTCPEVSERRAPSTVQVAMDGAMALMRPGEGGPSRKEEGTDPVDDQLEQQREGQRPKKRCGAREVKTAVITLPMKDGKERRTIRRGLVSVMGTADDLAKRLWASLILGSLLGPQTTVVVLGDGAEWIWERAKLFVRRIEILDLWHAAEHAWGCAAGLWGQGTAETRRWARALVRRVKQGKVADVVVDLEQLLAQLVREGAPATRQQVVQKLITYYRTHTSRMDYPRYLALGLSVGSGSVESCHRQVVHVRMRQAGMRWSTHGARHMIALREYYVRGAWSQAEALCGRKAA